MIVDHLPDGRTIADTAALVALTGRPVHAIRRHCHRGDRGYDADHCITALLAQPDPVVLTAAQADRYLGIPAGTIYSWVSRGQLTPLDRVSGRPVYDVADLTRLKEHC